MDVTVPHLEGEVWKVIPYGDGNYAVSNMGRVYSRSRPKVRGHIKKPSMAKYMRVSLNQGTKYKAFLVHKLVAEAFIGPRPDGYTVAHNNGDPTDNRVVNLRYATHKDNAADRWQHGTMLVGEKANNRKLDWAKVAEIRSSPETATSLAAKFGVAVNTVCDVRSGRCWKPRAHLKETQHEG